MIIMIIFLVLTVIFVIGTAIYLSKKKKNRFATETIRTKEEKIKRPKKKNKKQMADILNIKIKDNVICLGNRYSCVIRLGNIDYNMLSVKEQDAVESILIQTALCIDYPIQFFSTTEFIDTTRVIQTIRKNKPKNPYIKEYQEYIIEYLQNLMENRAISIVKNYAVVSFDGLYENAIDELNRRVASLKSGLLRTKISCETLDENELYNLVYRELNKNSSLRVDLLKEGGKQLYVGKKQKRKNTGN